MASERECFVKVNNAKGAVVCPAGHLFFEIVRVRMKIVPTCIDEHEPWDLDIPTL
jgi:hypothetical protein